MPSSSSSIFRGPRSRFSLTGPEESTFELLPLAESGEAHSHGSTTDPISPLEDDPHFEDIPLSDLTHDTADDTLYQGTAISGSQEDTRPTLAIVSFLKSGTLPVVLPPKRGSQPEKPDWRISIPLGKITPVIVKSRGHTPSDDSVAQDIEDNYIQPIQKKIKNDINPKINSGKMEPTMQISDLGTWELGKYMENTKTIQKNWEEEGSKIYEEIKSNPNEYFNSISKTPRDFKFENHTAESFKREYPHLSHKIKFLDYDSYQRELERNYGFRRRYERENGILALPTGSRSGPGPGSGSGIASGSGIDNSGTNVSSGKIGTGSGKLFKKLLHLGGPA